MSVVTISPRFQVVIPQRIREALGLEPGQKIQAIQYEDRIEFIPLRSAKSMRGFVRGIDTRVPRDRDRVITSSTHRRGSNTSPTVQTPAFSRRPLNRPRN